MSARHGTIALTLLIVYLLFWALMAIEPHDRETWLLENMLVFIYVPLIVGTYRYLRLSLLSYGLLFVFFCLHVVGAHYTYSEVPYETLIERVFGTRLSDLTGWQRNHFDRFVHLAFGLLIAYPCREIFIRIAGVRGFWGYFLPLIFVMSLSLFYELIEWWAAETFGGDLGMRYLGTQGDEWDGHRDMALASLGALTAMLITAAVNGALQRDFAREWHESLSVKQREPLGESAISRMLRARRHDPDDPALDDPRL